VLTLDTKRLMLRQVQEGNLNLFRNLLQDPYYLRYLPQNTSFSNIEVDTFMRRRIIHWRKGFGVFVIYLKSKPRQAIGFVGVESSPNPLYSDLRFMILKKYQGQGYAFEASARCIDFVFHSKLEKQIYAVCLVENKASVSVLKKLGMAEVENIMLYQAIDQARKTFRITSEFDENCKMNTIIKNVYI